MKKRGGVRMITRLLAIFFVMLMSITAASGCAGAASKKGRSYTQDAEISKEQTAEEKSTGSQSGKISEDGEYSSKEEVAEYIHLYGHLPDNYITKQEARDLGWVSSKGNLWDVAPGKSIGGDRFGNYEGNLPEKKGRKYFECDVGFDGGTRGPARIVYSSDGLIYYTEDHYNSFEELYGE